MSLKKKIKSVIPSVILLPLQRIHSKYCSYRRSKYEAKLIAAQPELHKKAVERVRTKQGPINVVFFALMDSVWKYDVLYRLMEKDERFNPVILVCPVVNYGHENMLSNMEKCYGLFKSRGYKVFRSYDEATNRYVDVRKELKPDVIFYTNPYKGLIDDRYYITEFPDILTCYTSYFFTNTPDKELTDTRLHNLVWKRYVENDYILQYSKINNRNKGINCIKSGYPGFDKLILDTYRPNDSWKMKDRSVKRIIWAPHHSINHNGTLYSSTFLDYYDYMFHIAEKYKGKIQIAFKPHPLLKNKLEILWGKEEAYDYYKRWETLENGLLNDGEYEDLFLTSDAIIHDCGSFIAEYLVTGKPAMFLLCEDKMRSQYNKIAYECLDNYYYGRNKDDIELFIGRLLSDNDELKGKRDFFVKSKLLPDDGKLASEIIVEDIIKDLNLN